MVHRPSEAPLSNDEGEESASEGEALTPTPQGGDAEASSGEELSPPVEDSPPRQASEPDWSDTLWDGRIRIRGEVGRGAMGYILRGRDTRLRRELALKVAPAPREELPKEQLARFIEEAQVTAQLEHPNVVPVHDFGLDPDGRAYFSMKLIRGQSLEDVLEKRHLGDERTLSEFGLRRLLDVFLQVCQAIEYAHAVGVIHRDLKPANIMVGDFGEVLVMDWGVAKLKGREDPPPSSESNRASVPPGSSMSKRPRQVSIEAAQDVSSVRAGKEAWQTQYGTVVGTPAYMSPEQAKGLAVDERSDVYSLGCVLYEILTGHVPFEHDDPVVTMTRHLSETPTPPHKLDRNVPPALEELVLRMLEKDPKRRTLSLAQVRAFIQNHIEGVGLGYRVDAWWTNLLWSAGALIMFAFLVWYLTGQSIAAVLVLGPSGVLNAVGWFLLALAVGYPLWGGVLAIRQSRVDHDRFRAPDDEELFVSGYLAHRTFAAALAPLFQLIFIVELISVTLQRLSRGTSASAELWPQVLNQMRTEWAQALITILVFLFGYLFLLSTEVRFARKIDRFHWLVHRPRWESLWPVFLILVLLTTIATTDVFEYTLAAKNESFWLFVAGSGSGHVLDLFGMLKTLVFQGTFLLGLVVSALMLSFPFAEVLAALRLPYQAADEASVRSKKQYFLRSLAVFRVLRASWLYGGAMIGSLTAITVLSEEAGAALLEKVLYILGPSMIGFVGYLGTQRYVKSFLNNAPAVQRMLVEQAERARVNQRRANLARLTQVPLRWQVSQLAVPVLCVLAYLVWTGSGVHQQAIRSLIVPVTMKGWLLILPYALLVPVLVSRDKIHAWMIRRANRETPSDSKA